MKQDDLVKAINNYIELDNNRYSAILINAHWVAWKTYFVKNVLFNEIKITLHQNNKHLFYISLNGINGINELHSRFNITKLQFGISKGNSKNKNFKQDSLAIVSTFT